MPDTNFTIYGTQGNDWLVGTAGNDAIYGDAGDDLIESGDGDDVIVDVGGSNIIRSGSGNDYVSIAYGFNQNLEENNIRVNVIETGDGNDVVDVSRGLEGLSVDLGGGNDLFLINQFGDNMVLTTGSGSDRIVLAPRVGSQLPSGQTLVITDFTAGDGGDVIDVSRVLGSMFWIGDVPNPFATGHISLVQDGNDVIIHIDADGFGPLSGGYAECDIVRLQNVSIASLTDYNFGGYHLDGSDSSLTTVNGTEDGEGLAAEGPGSIVNGFGGNDRIYGGYGDDQLNGGDGNDIIDGGLGDDQISGGAGNDTITDKSGGGIIDGGDGDDFIDIQRSYGSSNQADGIGALDYISIFAGAGNDLVRYSTNHGASASIDLGSGNDRFEIAHYVNNLVLTLGAGQDRVVFDQFYLNYANQPNDVHALIITDFSAGAGGDVLELDRVILGGNGWDGLANPFSSGHLLLQQSGADTLVIFNYDGHADQNYHFELARLIGVAASSLVAANFGGYDPMGAVSSYTVLSGTDGNDHLYDTNGADVINGGLGDDIIELNKSGADTVDGGAGNDIILVSNDYGPTGLVTLNGGTGNDLIDVSLRNDYKLKINAGSGDDRVILRYLSSTQNQISLGAGSDTLVLAVDLAGSGSPPILVTDFATGDSGDRLDWAAYVAARTMHSSVGYNPFYYGTARLVQNGANTELQIITYDTHVVEPLWTTVLVFANTTAANFTAFNLGFDPDFPTVQGTSGDDILSGTSLRDVIHGYAGNDQLTAFDGNDSLWGDEGNDVLDAGAGDDLLRGGAGTDTLMGGDGNDDLEGGLGADSVDGGNGDDLITDWDGSDTILGGAGNDRINVRLGFDNQFGTLNAGDGDDIVTVDNVYTRTGYYVDLGAGNDTIIFNAPFGQLRLGAGSDTIIWNTSYNRNGQLIVADFQAGNGGDMFDLRAFLVGAQLYAYADPSFTGNPFAAGYVELRQNGANVELYFHGAGYDETPEYGKNPDIIFKNRTIDQFTAANFSGFDPHVTPNWGTALRSDYTVAAGEIVTAHNVTGIYGYSPAFFIPLASNATLTNHGTIYSIVDGWPGAEAAGFTSYVSPPNGFVVNAADGEIYVSHSLSTAYGSMVNIQNAGLLEVTAPEEAYGVYYAALDNSGTLHVTSDGVAIGVYGNGSSYQPFVNTGTIEVDGGDLAFGVYWKQTSQSFTNAGTIVVTTDPSSPYASIGAYLWDDGSNPLDHYNDGTIVADIAIYADNNTRNNAVYDDAVERIHNNGTIIGDIMLAGGNDVVYNRGLISGQVLLEAGDDTYSGSGGVLDGLVDGGSGNDYLSGSSGSDFFLGGEGDDTLNTGSGNDFLVGGAGNDLLNGGSGIDTASYFDALAGVKVDLSLTLQQDTIGAGLDTLVGIEWLEGSSFKDILSGNSGANSLFGLAGADQLFGNDGNDILDGGLGNDLLDGGNGIDMASFASATSGVTVSLAITSAQTTGQGDDTLKSIEDLEGSWFGDTLSGNNAANTLYGLDGDDTLTGLAGDDYLFGGAGNDTLDGGAGLDRMYGGVGDDTYIVSDATDYAYENVGEGYDRVLSAISLTLRANVEELVLSGTGTLYGKGNELDNVITGNAWSNKLYGLDGNDTLYGGLGNDQLTGGNGADQLYGGVGNDFYYITDANDTVHENVGEGTDRVYASIDYVLDTNVEYLILTGTANLTGSGNAAANSVYGNDGDNWLYGLGGDDRLYGADGNDHLDGGVGGFDRMWGGYGDDVYYIHDATDYAYEFADQGHDLVYSDVSQNLRLYVEDLVLTGTADNYAKGNVGDNGLTGNSGANKLYGLAGNDTLDGGAGNDWLEGGAGQDLVTGGSGADDFVFRDGDFAGMTAGTADRILDFSQAEGDRIRLNIVDANTTLGGDQAFAFIGTTAFHGIAGELRYEQLGGNTYVMGDTNGDGNADFWIRLDGLHTLGTGDFIL